MTSKRMMIRGWMGGAVAFGIAVCANGSVTNLPFSDGFESGNINNWATNGAGAVSVEVSPAPAEGTKSCLADGDTLNLNSTVATGTNVWVRLFSKPKAYDDKDGRPDVGGCSAAFYVSTSGVLYAQTTNGVSNVWTSIKTGVSTTDWLGFLAHLDYESRLWDLYYTTGSTGSPMTKLNALPLSMGTLYSNRFCQLSVSCGGTTYLDAVSINRGYLDLVANTPSPTNVQPVASLTIPRGAAAREALLACIGAEGVSLGGEFGAILLAAINEGDRVHVINPTNSILFCVFEKDSDGEWLVIVGDIGPGQIRITRTTGFWIDSTASGSITLVGMSPYNSTSPTNVAVMTGWNFLQWPKSSRSVNSSLGITPVAGDLLYLYWTDGVNQGFKRLWWNSANGKWMRGGSIAATEQVQRAISMWYRRNGGNINWNIEGVSE